MVKNHLKRIAAPKAWNIPRKANVLITRPYGHLSNGMPIAVILKDALKVTQSRRETKAAVHAGSIKIDGRNVKDERQPAIILSVVSVLNDSYRVLLNKRGKLFFKKIDSKEAGILPSKVVSKTMLKGKKLQIGFHNGGSLLTDNNDIKIGDSVVLTQGKLTAHLPLEKGNQVYLVGGSNVGRTGTVESVGTAIVIKIGKDVIESAKSNVMVIGKDKPVVDVSES